MPELLDQTSVPARTVQSLFHTPRRYFRSVRLEEDFDDERALDSYVVTPGVAQAFTRIRDGLAPGSTHRVWRITGDYGTGKSSFALLVAQALRGLLAGRPALAAALHAEDADLPRLLPLLVTARRDGLGAMIADAVEALPLLRSGVPARLRNLLPQTRAGDADALVRLLDQLRGLAREAGLDGVLLVVDELGKFLEHASANPERQDVFVLQRLAEAAARSGDVPLVVVGVLHQGFQAYAERLGADAQHEWEKVAGRFEEIVFDQPLSQVHALVRAVLGLRLEDLPDDVLAAADRYARFGSPWTLGGTHLGGEDVATLYPLHPTMLPVLVRFFARFGQNERSLLSFLLSAEPFGVQEFSAGPASSVRWYRVPDFYDYVRANFGQRLNGGYLSHWARIVDTLDHAENLSDREHRVLRTVAVLNLLDAEHLSPTDEAVKAALHDQDLPVDVEETLAKLGERGLLFRRGGGGYRFWPTTSVNLQTALGAARQALGDVTRVAPLLAPFLDPRPLLARRHAIQNGTLRFFDVRYVPVEDLGRALAAPLAADGRVVIALCEREDDRHTAEALASARGAADRPGVVVGVTPPLASLKAELHEVRLWQWVVDHTPELAQDPYAEAEATRQLGAARRRLAARLEQFVPVREPLRDGEVRWWHAGAPLEVDPRGLPVTLSGVCDDLYGASPCVRNELINRHALSSAAAAARMRLLERLFTHADMPGLGFEDGKAPPEKSMYLSVLQAGRLHREVDGRLVIAEPDEHDDPLRLRPALRAVVKRLNAGAGERVPVPALYEVLTARPYGVRMGLAPLLLGVVVAAHGHRVAVYEDGSFLPRVDGAAFQRLLKAPATFDLQWAAVTGVRATVFGRLAQAFAPNAAGGDLLDVVTPLVVFAAELPEYTRRTRDLEQDVTRTRDALLAAREPVNLLFRDLPAALDLPAFEAEGPVREDAVGTFVERLRDATERLRGAYPDLLGRLRASLARAMDLGEPIDRAQLAARASRVALLAREARVRAFALRLADEQLGDDGWVEALASTVLSKPPRRWVPGDEVRCVDEFRVLAVTFRRLEAFRFAGNPAFSERTYRVGLTRVDGAELFDVVELTAQQEADVSNAVRTLEERLPTERTLRLAALTQMLWGLLDKTPEENDPS